MKKIPTLFLRDEKNRALVTKVVNPSCQWVINGEGVATQKYDGTCCKIDADGYWKRREVGKDKAPPLNFVEEEIDLVTGKRFGWVLVDPLDPSDRYHMEAFKPDLPHGTYELCGPKIQGNPEKFGAHVLIRHKSPVTTFVNPPPRSFLELEQYFMEVHIEGIVWHHQDGRMAKIKARDFGVKR